MESDSPACILSFVITAGLRGELREAWNWSDEPENKLEGGSQSRVEEEKDTKPEIAPNHGGKQEISTGPSVEVNESTD